MNRRIPLALDARRTREILPPPIVALDEDSQPSTEALAAALIPPAIPQPADPLLAESLVAALRWVFGRDASVDEAADWIDTAPAPDLDSLRHLDTRGRSELCRAAVLVSLADQRRLPQRAAAILELARALELDPEALELDLVSMVSAGKLNRFRWRLFDDSLTELAPPGSERGRLGLLWQAFGSVFGLLRPKRALAARFEALGELPRETVGWALHRHYRVHGFPTPGESRGFSEMIVPHELAHVVSGYEPHPYGEMLIAAFHAGNSPSLTMATLLLGMLQYHHGIKVDYRAERGLLVPDEFFRAYARGCATTLDLHELDWSTVVERDLERFRAAIGLPGVEARQGSDRPEKRATSMR